jgi:hypothetical protein
MWELPIEILKQFGVHGFIELILSGVIVFLIRAYRCKDKAGEALYERLLEMWELRNKDSKENTAKLHDLAKSLESQVVRLIDAVYRGK